jgi:hypothetical protein
VLSNDSRPHPRDVFLEGEATPNLSSALARPTFTTEEAVRGGSMGIQEVGGSPECVVPSVFTDRFTDRQAMDIPVFLVRKPDPKDEDTEGVLPLPDHLRRLNPRQETRESLRARHQL